ncbi:right-handed parallel beta-helix repeat-containing protein [Myxococcota bacterium]|nr:right-handed parallel beta-helix repeat-containing protein [Myxococcota bacterium]MBU1512168.1 right-handed parallel beta-helix repeat-containing protein [Myxococcota bacterium]
MRNPTLILCATALLAACSSPGRKAPVIHDPPPVVCEAPAGPVDVSTPDHVVGDGSAGSCTEGALREAAVQGGIIVFNCGADPVVIPVRQTVVFTTDAVVDGGGLVTLDGGSAARIFLLDANYNVTTPVLTVQRLAFRGGAAPRTGDDTADGGGAIYRDGGSLVAIDCDFIDNHAPATGQDLAGGAIYAFGGGSTTLVGCRFEGNSASDGGAVGSLNGDLIVVNSVFTGNAATGSDGNPGDGGCGGAIYQDGADERTAFCGVTIRGNTAGAIGGGVFRVSNDGTGTFTMERTAVDANTVTETGGGNAGGLYLQGLDLHVVDSTISRNEAHYNGGLWIHTCQVRMTNTTVAGNSAVGSNGGGLWLSGAPTGLLLNCTLADNHADADGQGAGAVFGGDTGLVLQNTLIVGNTGWWGPGCSDTLGDGGGNLQFTGEAPCTAQVTVVDPLLGPLGDHGGPVETLLPSATGPAVGAGTDCPASDATGRTRPIPCTSGAAEP